MIALGSPPLNTSAPLAAVLPATTVRARLRAPKKLLNIPPPYEALLSVTVLWVASSVPKLTKPPPPPPNTSVDLLPEMVLLVSSRLPLFRLTNPLPLLPEMVLLVTRAGFEYVETPPDAPPELLEMVLLVMVSRVPSSVATPPPKPGSSGEKPPLALLPEMVLLAMVRAPCAYMYTPPPALTVELPEMVLLLLTITEPKALYTPPPPV